MAVLKIAAEEALSWQLLISYDLKTACYVRPKISLGTKFVCSH